jgi:hypothetical protein
VNGQEPIFVDRGRWLYQFELDAENITIARTTRSGQYLASPELWRCVAQVGVTDAFVVPCGDGWQPFIELAEGRQRWALAQRATLAEAEETATHFLAVLADAVAHFATLQASAEGVPSADGADLPAPGPFPSEGPAVEQALADAREQRQADGWELVYNRPRASRS